MLYTSNLRNAVCALYLSETWNVRKEMPGHFGSWIRQLLCSWTVGGVSTVMISIFFIYLFRVFPT